MFIYSTAHSCTNLFSLEFHRHYIYRTDPIEAWRVHRLHVQAGNDPCPHQEGLNPEDTSLFSKRKVFYVTWVFKSYCFTPTQIFEKISVIFVTLYRNTTTADNNHEKQQEVRPSLSAHGTKYKYTQEAQ